MGRYLAREHDFAHYDLECHPRGWPHPDLKAVWDASRQQFIRQLGLRHERVALDWGFPVRCLTVVRELQGLGVRLIWFNGDGDRAREVFVQRGGIDVACFDRQMHDIRAAGYPDTLGATVVPVLSSAGTFLDWTEVERIVFA